MLDPIFVKRKIEDFLIEDIGFQDITTDNIGNHKTVTADIIAKEDMVVAGVDIALQVFKIIDDNVQVLHKIEDGSKVKKTEKILTIRTNSKTVLKGERTALNILQRLSGIATNTSRYINQIMEFNVKLLDTRKTTPGFRAFEKYAVKVGGAYNHRFALYDMVLIKDNHIRLVGSIKKAVNQIKQKVSPFVKIEVEVSNLIELEEALETDVDIIMLDNMTLEEIEKAVKINNKRKKLEVSGNITIDNIKEVAKTGVDFISSGSIIHSSRWMDISLKIK